MASLGREIAGLAKGWWRGDRIRLSPREGRLLRIPVPGRLWIGRTPVAVLRRTIAPAGEGIEVAYHCQVDGREVRLQVELDATGRIVQVHWIVDGEPKPLSPGEVDVAEPGA